MSDDEWSKELAKLERRIALVVAVQRGDVKLKRIVVKRKKMRWTVNARRRTYVRYVAPPGWKPPRGNVRP